MSRKRDGRCYWTALRGKSWKFGAKLALGRRAGDVGNIETRLEKSAGQCCKEKNLQGESKGKELELQRARDVKSRKLRMI